MHRLIYKQLVFQLILNKMIKFFPGQAEFKTTLKKLIAWAHKWWHVPSCHLSTHWEAAATAWALDWNSSHLSLSCLSIKHPA